MNVRQLVLAVCAVVLAFWLSTTIFTVDQTELALVTRFGRPLGNVYRPGLHAKMPWPIDDVRRVDSRLLVFDNEPAEMLTFDKKNVVVDSFLVWRIVDPLLFTQTLRSRDEAEARLLDVSSSQLGAAIGREPIDAFISPVAETVRIREIARGVGQRLDAVTRESFGIEVVDLQINGFNLPPQNRASVIDRMRAERARIATRYRSEGEEEALRIEARAAAERERLTAEAESRARALRGAGEAEAIEILAEAYDADPELYRFLRTLESYESILDEETTLFLESDSRLMRTLTDGR